MLATAPCALADRQVAVSAFADAGYTQRKYGADGKVKPETYVVMRGTYFAGMTVDKSIARTTFRDIVSVLAPELARRQYWPAKQVEAADLAIVVHWGTTSPQVSTLEMTGQTALGLNRDLVDSIREVNLASTSGQSDVTSSLLAEMSLKNALETDADKLEQLMDHVANDSSSANIAQLLGYTRGLRKHADRPFGSIEESIMRHDMREDRYFIIVKAYDLRSSNGRKLDRATWTLHLNMRSAGTNFQTALARMSQVAPSFLGKTTDDVSTVKWKEREGRVDIGTPVIVNDP